MKKKLSLTEKISLAENNAVDFMHACVTIALHDEYEVGVQRLRKVNLRRDEINEEMLEVMAQPRKSGREQAAAGQAWLVSLLPEGAETEFRVPLGKGAARKQKELQIRMAVDNAATLEWRVYAAACAEVLGFGAKRLNDLHKAVLENFRQLSAWAIEDGVDVALERFLPLRPGRLQDRRAGGGHPGRTGAASAAAPDPAGTGRAGRAGLDGGGQPQAGGLPAAGPGGSGKAHPDRAAGPGHAGELGEEAGEMTLKEAMGYRGENADTLAEKIGIRAGEITKWMRPAGLLRVPSARLQQLAVALDGGVLVTADGVEVELYGSGGNA